MIQRTDLLLLGSYCKGSQRLSIKIDRVNQNKVAVKKGTLLMDTLYHVSEVTFFLLTGGMIYWLIANNQPAQPEPAPSLVRISTHENQ